MNKDVIYIEPEDDITDVIAKIEKSKEKIVALVPPKKAGVFRSIVNIKLIYKAGKSAEKTIVLVTVDPSIVKLAASIKLPVTKDLNTAPVIPTIDDESEIENVSKEELVESPNGEVEAEEEEEDEKDAKDEDAKEDAGDEDDDEEGEDEKKEDKKSAKKSKEKKNSSKKNLPEGLNKIIEWIKDHKKLSIACGIGLVLLILFMIWAFAIAPAVTVSVGVKASSNNFSEALTFTTELSEEDSSIGKFYLEEKKIETPQEVEFEATGKKNVGDKASGELVIYDYFYTRGVTQVDSGSQFTFNGLTFVADKTVTLSWDGETADACENNGQASAFGRGCLISARINVTAAEPGSKYNVSPSNSGWDNMQVKVYSDKAITGGTDKEVTVVQQSDVEKAKSQLTTNGLDENKAKLLEEIGDDSLAIESSLAQNTSDPEITPKVGEEVKDGAKATLKVVTTTSIFVIDKTKVIEFITEKANLKDDQKIYEMKDPFIENFLKTDSGYTGKLKTSYLTGPNLTETSIADLIKGHGIGDATHMLKDIDGVVDARIDGSFPWVSTVPGDTNKITVYLEVKDQNGNKVEQKNEDEESKDSKDSKDSEKSDGSEESKDKEDKNKSADKKSEKN
ncbi:hypothetical protein J5491_03710 [Candidatus Saccharibacteria bacterium]|nr:hypothetical protein [Candidatus Saccharibacteria bacterium]